MCLALPGRILSIADSGDPVTGRTATVDFQGSRMEASLAMTPEAGESDWVLVHAGFALTVLDEAEARETWETLKMAFGDGIELLGAPDNAALPEGATLPESTTPPENPAAPRD